MPLLAQVGEQVDFAVTVSNPSDVEVHDVVVVDLVPDEVDVIAVPATSDVQAIELGRSRHHEDIVWVLGSLAPGAALRLEWTGEVSSPGDLEAVNAVSATSRETLAIERNDAIYLGFVRSFRIDRSSPAMQAHAPGFAASMKASIDLAADAAPGSLPATGVWLGDALAIAGLFLAIGSLLVLGPSRNARAATLVLMLGLAVCSPGGPGEPVTRARVVGSARAAHPPEDRVLGVRIHRDKAKKVVAAPTDAEPQESPGLSISSEQAPEIETRDFTSKTADNSLQLDWDLEAKEIVSALSSRLFEISAESDLTTSLTSTPQGLQVEVAASNASDGLLRVHGRFLLEVVGDSGQATTFESDPVDETIEPGDSTGAAFSFLLPTGSFDLVGSFVAAADR